MLESVFGRILKGNYKSLTFCCFQKRKNERLGQVIKERTITIRGCDLCLTLKNQSIHQTKLTSKPLTMENKHNYGQTEFIQNKANPKLFLSGLPRG